MEIILYPDPILRTSAKDIAVIDKRIKDLARDMFRLMYDSNGIGLAANQVGILERICVINIDPDKNVDNELVLINPIIKKRKGTSTDVEGCLSLPNLRMPVVRAKSCLLNAFDLNGNEINLRCNNLLCRAVLHELDHLCGILIIDKADDFNQKIINNYMDR